MDITLNQILGDLYRTTAQVEDLARQLQTEKELTATLRQQISEMHQPVPSHQPGEE